MPERLNFPTTIVRDIMNKKTNWFSFLTGIGLVFFIFSLCMLCCITIHPFFIFSGMVCFFIGIITTIYSYSSFKKETTIEDEKKAQEQATIKELTNKTEQMKQKEEKERQELINTWIIDKAINCGVKIPSVVIENNQKIEIILPIFIQNNSPFNYTIKEKKFTNIKLEDVFIGDDRESQIESTLIKNHKQLDLVIRLKNMDNLNKQIMDILLKSICCNKHIKLEFDLSITADMDGEGHENQITRFEIKRIAYLDNKLKQDNNGIRTNI